MAPKNQICESCGKTLSSQQRLISHYASNRNNCQQQTPIPNPLPEIDTEAGPGPRTQAHLAREEEMPHFELTDIRHSGLKNLDAYYRAKIPEQAEYSRDPLSTLNILRPQIEDIFHNRFKLTHGFKARIYLIAIMERYMNYMSNIFSDPVNDDGTVTLFSLDRCDYKEIPFKNKAVVISSCAEISGIIDNIIWDIERRVDKYIHEGSGWYFKVSQEVNIEMPIYEPLVASSHLPLPKGIPSKHNGINNIQNEDNRCFEWCILADLHPSNDNANKTSKYKDYIGQLNFDGITFPVRADELTMQKFERQNQDLAISIYGWSEKRLIPIRIASKTNRKLICLLLISGVDPMTKEDAQHYCLIKGREGLGRLADYTTKHKKRLYICDWCVF